MSVAFVLLALGSLCTVWDVLFSVDVWEAGGDTYGERLANAWAVRRMTVIGGVLILASLVAEAADL